MDILTGARTTGPAMATPEAAGATGTGLYVQFRLKNAQTKWGQNLAVVGNTPALRNWQVSQTNTIFKLTSTIYHSIGCAGTEADDEQADLSQVGVERASQVREPAGVLQCRVQVRAG